MFKLNALEAVEQADYIDTSNSRISALVSKAILISLQILIALSIVHCFKYIILPDSDLGSNTITILLGSLIATISAFLVLSKYQALLQQFSLRSEELGKHIDERHEELLKANTEMRLEIAERKKIEAALAESEARLLQANKEMRLEIAQRARIEAALAQSEARFRAIIRESAIGIAVLNMKGRLIEWNPALQKMLGYTHDELSKILFAQLNHPEDDAALFTRPFRELLHGKRNTFRVEKRYIRKDGQEGWWRHYISLIRNKEGKAQFVIAMIEDITERRQTEEKIRRYQERLQSLASELSLTEERERRTLAEVLHDQIGQILSIVKIKLEEMQESKPYRRLAIPIQEIHRLIEKSISCTRSLIYELSPPLLYDIGFEATVEWLADHMHKQYGLEIQVENDDQAKPLDNEERILLFRAVRELLFNVIKHAHASLVKVSIQRINGNLQVTVEDNGVGFTPDKGYPELAQANDFGGFGLFSIRERLHYFGGDLEINSALGQGTRAILIIPIKDNGKKRRSCGRSLDDPMGCSGKDLNPKIPQLLAGTLTEPPLSVPRANSAKPQATAAAEPLEKPPRTLSGAPWVKGIP